MPRQPVRVKFEAEGWNTGYLLPYLVGGHHVSIYLLLQLRVCQRRAELLFQSFFQATTHNEAKRQNGLHCNSALLQEVRLLNCGDMRVAHALQSAPGAGWANRLQVGFEPHTFGCSVEQFFV